MLISIKVLLLPQGSYSSSDNLEEPCFIIELYGADIWINRSPVSVKGKLRQLCRCLAS